MKPMHRYFTLIAVTSLLLTACSAVGLPATGPQKQPVIPIHSVAPALPNTAAPQLTQPVEAPRVVTAEVTTPAVSPSIVARTITTSTINCTSPASLTPALTEGPYWKAGSPEKSNLTETGMPGTKITIRGVVLTEDCQPVPNAWVDFWQSDAAGVYDNSGYTLRGHQYTNANGRYEVVTVVPGEYPGRRPHIHVKVQAPNGPVLTTQLFFPGDYNDPIFDPALVLAVQIENGDQAANFNFIIKTK